MEKINVASVLDFCGDSGYGNYAAGPVSAQAVKAPYGIFVVLHIGTVLFSFSCNAAFFFAFVNARLYAHSFYLIVLQLCVASSLLVLVEAIDALTSYRAGTAMYSSFWGSVFQCFTLIPNFGTMFFSLLMTINRLCIFYPLPSGLFTSRLLLSRLLALLWICSICFPAVVSYAGCYRAYNEKEMAYRDTCTRISSREAATITMNLFQLVTYTCCLTMLFIYIVIFFRIRDSRRLSVTGLKENSVSSSSPETRLLFQSIAIFALYTVAQILFAVLPFLMVSEIWLFYLTFSSNLLGLLLAGLNPLIFVLMTKTCRRVLSDFITKLLCAHYEALIKKRFKASWIQAAVHLDMMQEK